MENLTISLPEGTDLEPVGVISSIVDQLGMFTQTQIRKSDVADKTGPF